MVNETRREFLALSGLASAALLGPVRALAQAVKPVRIRDVELFRLDIPVSKAELEISETIGYGVNHAFRSTSGVVKVVTDAGINGYSFAGGYRLDVLPQLREILVGKDLFAVQQHLRQGLGQWGGAEHAVWDAIGRIAGQPVYRLLGGTKTSIKAYLTFVWRDGLNGVSYQDQAEMGLKAKQAGFKGMKIQAWRPNPTDDADACREIRAAVGPDFAIMFDRTAHAPKRVGQKIWDYETGLKSGARHGEA